jgi:hypothetical protein
MGLLNDQMHPSWACCMIRLNLAEHAIFFADPSLNFRINAAPWLDLLYEQMIPSLPIKGTNLPKMLYKSGSF